MKREFIIKVALLLMVFFSFSLFANDADCGNDVHKTITVAPFTAINASKNYDIDVVIGKAQSVVIETTEKAFKHLKYYVKDNTLYLSTVDDINISDDVEVEIRIPALNRVDLSGACEIDVKNISGNSFSITASGASEGELQGSVTNLYLSLSGAAEFDTEDLKAKNVTVHASGSSELDVFCSNSLSLNVSGSSKITVYGHPIKVESNTSGISSVKYK